MGSVSCCRALGVVAALLLSAGGHAQAFRPSIFEPVTSHLITGDEFLLKIAPVAESDRPSISDISIQASCADNVANAGDGARSLGIAGYRQRIVDGDSYLILPVPSRERLAAALHGELDRACLVLTYQIGSEREEMVDRFDLLVPSQLLAYLVAFGFLGAFFLFLGTLQTKPLKPRPGFRHDQSEDLWKEENSRVVRALKFPLAFAITPMGSYSISLFQALLWTYLTMFMSVYIYWLYGSLLDLTPQMLAMLGIGGTTAVASKVNAVSRSYSVPEKYLKLIDRTRTPRLSDLISTNERPNLFKFQILVFTLIAGGFVLIETLDSYQIPQIPESLVTLMGLSTVVYLGNEVAAENVWTRVKALQDEIEEQASQAHASLASQEDVEELAREKPEVAELVEQMKSALQAIYT